MYHVIMTVHQTQDIGAAKRYPLRLMAEHDAKKLRGHGLKPAKVVRLYTEPHAWIVRTTRSGKRYTYWIERIEEGE